MELSEASGDDKKFNDTIQSPEMSTLERSVTSKLEELLGMMIEIKTKMVAHDEELQAQNIKIEALTKDEKVRKNSALIDDRMNLDQEVVTRPEDLPRHKTGDLKAFSGDRSEWIAWRTEAQTKLNTDGRAIGNDREKFGYLYMHLQIGAQKRIQQWYNMCLKTNTNCNPMAFLERAEATFGDPNEKKNARTLLSATKQGNNESFSDFITKFEELLAQAGGEEWPQDVQVDTLEDSLNKEMQSRLVSYQLIDPTYNTFRSACLSIDAKLQAMRMRSKSSGQLALPGSTGRSGQGNGQERAGGRERERAPWATAEERERRRIAGLCLRCGGADHMQKKCRFRSAVYPRSKDARINEAQIQTIAGSPQKMIEATPSYSENV